MNIAYTVEFKAGKYKGQSPADVIMKADNKDQAIADLVEQRAWLENNLSNERYREANQNVINAITAAINLYNSGNLTSPQAQEPIDPSIAYTCLFSAGQYKGMSPADVILSSQDKEETVEALREQYRAFKNSNPQLASAISIAGKLYNEGKLQARRRNNNQSIQAANQNSPKKNAQEHTQPKEYSTMKDILRNGSLMVCYGQKYLCNVAPAFNIHKVRWSIVELETGGQKHWDFYMSLDDFRRLCEDIDSDNARKKFLQDIDKAIPNAYQFVAGDNGSKHLNLGGGKKGVRVNISIQNEGYANTVVQYTALKDMSFYFKLVSGLIPVSRYYGELVDAFWEGDSERNSYYQQN